VLGSRFFFFVTLTYALQFSALGGAPPGCSDRGSSATPEEHVMMRQNLGPGVPGLANHYHGGGCMPHGGLMENGAPHGGLVRVIPKLFYNARPGAGFTHEVVLAKYVDTTFWVSGVLKTRVFAKNFPDANQKFEVRLFTVTYEEEDPGIDMIEASARTVQVLNNAQITATPRLLITPIVTPIGGQMRVTLFASQPAGVTTEFSVTIGVDIIGRPA
jgi:hypothetical protein